MANGAATETGKSKSKRASKPKNNQDVCAYVWEQGEVGWGWSLVNLDEGVNADALVNKLVEAGKFAVVGKLSIGAPEGPPSGWTDPAHSNGKADVDSDDTAKIDASIVAAIKAHNRKLADIVKATGLDDRLVDRRLQRMRKTSVLSFLKGVGWCLTASLQEGDDEPVTVQPSTPEPAGEPIPPAPAPAPVKPAKKARKSKPESQPEVPWHNQANVPGPKVDAVEEAKVEPATGDEVIGQADADGVARPQEPGDFLLFIGGNFYTKDNFIKEAAEMGISRRMPSHRVPKDLISGKSRVFVAAEGKRKADDGANTSEVFGYFIPGRVEFISLGNDKQYADIIAALQMRPDSRIIDSIKNEGERGCGTRKEGGTYLVVDKADSPLHMLAKPATYVGNHFRGLMRLSKEQAATFSEGGEVATLVDEECMICGAKFKCAPDGHIRAERERRRMEKGEEPKWRLPCGECRRKAMAEKAKARKEAQGASQAEVPAEVEGDEEGSDALMGTD